MQVASQPVLHVHSKNQGRNPILTSQSTFPVITPHCCSGKRARLAKSDRSLSAKSRWLPLVQAGLCSRRPTLAYDLSGHALMVVHFGSIPGTEKYSVCRSHLKDEGGYDRQINSHSPRM